MTTIELLGVVLGGGTVSAVVGSVTTALASRRADRTKAREGSAAVEVAHVEASTKAADLMSELIGEMRAERVRLIAESDAKRLAHGECLVLVSELRGHVDQLEPRLQTVEAALDECREAHATSKAALAEFRRSVSSELAKRPPSSPGFPAAKE